MCSSDLTHQDETLKPVDDALENLADNVPTEDLTDVLDSDPTVTEITETITKEEISSSNEQSGTGSALAVTGGLLMTAFGTVGVIAWAKKNKLEKQGAPVEPNDEVFKSRKALRDQAKFLETIAKGEEYKKQTVIEGVESEKATFYDEAQKRFRTPDEIRKMAPGAPLDPAAKARLQEYMEWHGKLEQAMPKAGQFPGIDEIRANARAQLTSGQLAILDNPKMRASATIREPMTRKGAVFAGDKAKIGQLMSPEQYAKFKKGWTSGLASYVMGYQNDGAYSKWHEQQHAIELELNEKVQAERKRIQTSFNEMPLSGQVNEYGYKSLNDAQVAKLGDLDAKYKQALGVQAVAETEEFARKFESTFTSADGKLIAPEQIKTVKGKPFVGNVAIEPELVEHYKTALAELKEAGVKPGDTKVEVANKVREALSVREASFEIKSKAHATSVRNARIGMIGGLIGAAIGTAILATGVGLLANGSGLTEGGNTTAYGRMLARANFILNKWTVITASK